MNSAVTFARRELSSRGSDKRIVEVITLNYMHSRKYTSILILNHQIVAQYPFFAILVRKVVVFYQGVIKYRAVQFSCLIKSCESFDFSDKSWKSHHNFYALLNCTRNYYIYT